MKVEEKLERDKKKLSQEKLKEKPNHLLINRLETAIECWKITLEE